MRSPSPKRHPSDRKRISGPRPSPPGFKRPRSRSLSPRRRFPPKHRSYSPRRRVSSPRRRSRSPRRRSKSPRRSRSPRKRSPKRRSPSPKRKNVSTGRNKSRSKSRERFGSNKPDSQPGLNRTGSLADRGYPQGSQAGYNPRSRSTEGLRPSSPNRSARGMAGEKRKLSPEFGSYSRSSRGDVDYRMLPPPEPRSRGQAQSPPRSRGQLSSPPKVPQEPKRFDQTDVTVNDRFLSITGPVAPFSPGENITIGIERSIAGDEPAIIRREIDPSEVIVVRGKNEGAKCLCKREEFLGPKEEYVEKRTIKVASTDKPRHRSREEKDTRRIMSDDWGIVEPFRKTGLSREELDDFILDPPRSEMSRHLGDRDDRMGSKPRLGNLGYGSDRDERVVLERKFTVNIGDPPRSFEGQEEPVTRFERDPNDLRHNLMKKKGKDGDSSFDARMTIDKKRTSSSGEKTESIDVRQKLLRKREYELKKREQELKKRSHMLEVKERKLGSGRRGDDGKKGENLPDFSNRPDKYQPNPEDLDPLVTPKGIMYYEHDNRDRPAYISRGRGFRGRGYVPRGRGFISPRGRGFVPRGRGYKPRDQGYVPRYNPTRDGPRRDSDLNAREWKHDKFQEMDENREEKPSSTT